MINFVDKVLDAVKVAQIKLTAIDLLVLCGQRNVTTLFNAFVSTSACHDDHCVSFGQLFGRFLKLVMIK
jgi:hypothetical protein